MKKIFLAWIISLFFVNFSFANNQNCEINYLVKAENKEKFVNCEKSEEIIALNEKNWKFIYISKIDSENDFKIKINENQKIIFEKIFTKKDDFKVKESSITKVFFSKYLNHNLAIFDFKWFSFENEKEYDLKELNGLYLDWKKISDKVDTDKIVDFLGKTDFQFDLKYDDYNKKIDIFLDLEELDSFYFFSDEAKWYFLLQKVWNLFKEKNIFLEKSEEKYFLEENYRKNIDKFLEKFFKNPKNIAKINNFLEKIEEKKSFYTKNTKWYEIYNYLISELKILQIKNK